MNNNTQTEESIIQLLHSDDVDDVALGIIIAVRLYGREWFPSRSKPSDERPPNAIMTNDWGHLKGGVVVLFADGTYIYGNRFFEYINSNLESFHYMKEKCHIYEYGE